MQLFNIKIIFLKRLFAGLICVIFLAVKDSLFLINTTIKQMYNLRGRDATETKK